LLIDISRVKISDRIRRDYGDIEDLASDIKENGLINPPVVTPDFELIAGERRLRAMKYLGYQQVEVRVMQVKDYEHMLKLEINENENRKDFTRLERLEYARRLERIERVKAKERQGARTDISQNFGTGGRAEDAVAKRLDIGSGEQYRKEKYIAEHADKETLEAWDKGKISTHKAYTRIKELEKQVKELQQKNKELKERKPEIIEKEVIPEHIKDKLLDLEEEKKILEKRAGDLDKARMELTEYNRKKKEIENEMENLMDTMRRLQENYDKKNSRLTLQANLLNKIKMATNPLKKSKGELERLFNSTGELDQIATKEIMSEVNAVYDIARFIEKKANEIKGEVVYFERE